MVDCTNHIWSAIIYNVILLCDGEVIVTYFHIFLYMIDSTKWLASVGLAQAHPN